MKILALEFSSLQRGVALVEAEAPALPGKGPSLTGDEPSGARREPAVLASALETSPRSTNAIGLIEQVLTQAGTGQEQIEAMAIGLGPGSYTGIRSAIAVAQGWQLARGIRLLGLSSVDCLAAQAQSRGWTGRFLVVIDAQRGEFYLAIYQVTPAQCQLLEPLRLVSRPEVEAQLLHGGVLAGPEVDQRFPRGRPLFPSAETLARMAAGRHDSVQGHDLEPIYLRAVNFVKAPPPRIRLND